MNAMNRNHLDIAGYNPLYFKKLYTKLVIF